MLLKDQIITLLKQEKPQLSQKFGVLSLALFGSISRNEERPSSDVDLLVELQPEFKTFDNYMDLLFFLENKLERKIDLGIKDSIRKEILECILKEAIYA